MLRRRRNPGKATAADAHLHKDSTVTRGQLDSFGDEEVAVQLEVLARLRAGAASQDATHLLALISLGVSVFAILFVYVSSSVPHATTPLSTAAPWWVQPLEAAGFFITLAVMVVVILAATIWDVAKSGKKRERAIVWLAAYTDELTRLRTQPGAAGRRWRQKHPI